MFEVKTVKIQFNKINQSGFLVLTFSINKITPYINIKKKINFILSVLLLLNLCRFLIRIY